MKNSFRVSGGTACVQTNSGVEFLVSDIDIAWMQTIDNTWFVNNRGYVTGRINGSIRQLARLLANPGSGLEVDHIDRNPLNNTRENLRVVTRSQNMMNKKPRGLGYTSVGKKWNVQVTRGGRKINKLVDTEDEARNIVATFRKSKQEEIETRMPPSLGYNLLSLSKEQSMKAKEFWKSRRLSDDDIRGIIFTLQEGSVRQKDLAEVYGVTQAYISRLVNGKTKRGQVVVR